MNTEPNTKKVKEERKRGTRGGPYIYVVEGNELVHISEYSIKTLPGKFEDEVVYEVPMENVSGKVLYCFDFSRSGGEFLRKCRIEDFEDSIPKKYEYYELLEKQIHEIRNLTFRIKDPTLTSLILEFNQLFIPMINEIKEHERKQNFECSFMGHQARLANAIENPELYYFTFMSLPQDESRIKSLMVTRKWIYQLWVLKLVCESLQVSKFLYHRYQEKPYWWIEQGSEASTCVGETPFGDMTFWLEFQPSKGAHMMGMFVSRRVPIRPDVIIVKGRFERTKNFIDSGNVIDVLIECKEDLFIKWKNEINLQILPYLRNFKPNLFVLASLQPVPGSAKEYLKNQGIKIVDNLRPNSASVGLLHDLISKEICKDI